MYAGAIDRHIEQEIKHVGQILIRVDFQRRLWAYNNVWRNELSVHLRECIVSCRLSLANISALAVNGNFE
jgi:hypothetical protein